MKILVPTDFSDNAMKAAVYAAELAKQTEAEIILLNVHETGYEKIRQPFPLHEKYDKLVLDRRRNDMKTLKESILVLYKGLHINTELEDGVVVESITELASREKVDMIVMGTTGAGTIKEALIGTVAAAVAGCSSVPVLTIPAQYEMEKPNGIVFTTNRFEKNAKVLDILVKLARIFNTTIHTLVFIDKDTADAGDYMEKGTSLDHYLKFLKRSYPDIDFTGELLEGTNFEAAVNLYHVRHETDISAMVSYPKELWERLLHKSATKKMIYHSHIPVLAIPSAEKLKKLNIKHGNSMNSFQ